MDGMDEVAKDSHAHGSPPWKERGDYCGLPIRVKSPHQSMTDQWTGEVLEIERP